MSAWTTNQNDTLRAYGHEGAKGVQRRLRDECGAKHSIRAIEMQASRLGVSLVRLTACKDCGVLYRNTAGGIGSRCRRCKAAHNAEEARAFNEAIRREIEEMEQDPSTDENEREYARLRKENSRLCRKHGLPGVRERKRSAKD